MCRGRLDPRAHPCRSAARPGRLFVEAQLAGGGLRGIAEILAVSPRVAVVVVAEETDEEEFLDAVRLGAAGYVLASIAPASLAKVVQAVMVGEAAIPRSLVIPLIERFRKRPLRRHLAVPHKRGVDLTSRGGKSSTSCATVSQRARSQKGSSSPR